MDPKRWREIERLCQTALEMEQGKREAYLTEACGGDESLKKEVEALLANQPETEGFLNEPAMEAAAKTLAKDREDVSAGDLIGRTVAHYRIVQKIGQGGKGEVFLAEDTSLRRKVALKFLPPEMQQDAVARKRLLREAHAAASLDNPYICSIDEVGDCEGKDFIVMEYVDGQTLKERLARGPLSVKQAIRAADEVAEALEEAHEKRIVHRDLKPANIMLTRMGHAKVMDFGLAKQLIPPGGIESQEESVTALTRSGMTLGTLAYMSPEQLRGETADAWSDIFSFGVVLYEMLAGVHPFKKETGMDTASAILQNAPQPLGEIRRDAPVLLQHIVRKMLAKDPRNRYPSIHDVRTDLKELQEEPDRPAEKRLRLGKPWYWIAATALMVVGAGAWHFLQVLQRGVPLPPPRFVPVTTFAGREVTPSLSPDGHWIAFQWNGEKQDNWDIYVKELDGRGFNRLTYDPAPDYRPAWSPDGRQIAFMRVSQGRRMLYLISPLGGGERKVAEVGIGELSWSPDGKNIAFVDRKSPKDPPSVWSLSLETLEKKQMTTPDPSSRGDAGPAFSPDGRYLAFVRAIEAARPALYVLHLPRGELKLVTDYTISSQPCWTTDSREIVFATGSWTGEAALWRIFREGGKPRRVPTRGELVSQPSISRNRLAYASRVYNADIWRLDLTERGSKKPPAKPLISWSSLELDQRISPDGSRIAFASASSGSLEIWVCDADGANSTKLTDMKAGSTGSPHWSPDGKNLAFDSTRSGNQDIYVVSVEGGPVRPITSDPTEDAVPRWSRDGRWIYFGSNRSGNWQIWKMPAEGGKAVQVSREGGLASLESDDGYVYFYGYFALQKKGIWRVPKSGGPETLVLDKQISPLRWDLTDHGIYFIDHSAKPVATICFYDFANRRVESLAPVHGGPDFVLTTGLSVSPDGKWLLYAGGVSSSDIMLIDNFR